MKGSEVYSGSIGAQLTAQPPCCPPITGKCWPQGQDPERGQDPGKGQGAATKPPDSIGGSQDRISVQKCVNDLNAFKMCLPFDLATSYVNIHSKKITR